MLIAKIDNLVPVHYREVFKNTSFPASGPSDQFLAENGYAKVIASKPHDGKTQKLVPIKPVLKDGVVYTVDVASKTAEDQKADLDAQAGSIRAQRNSLLSACDWTQLADVSLDPLEKGEWSVYRQLLRDVPQQIGFPSEVTWPKEPARKQAVNRRN